MKIPVEFITSNPPENAVWGSVSFKDGNEDAFKEKACMEKSCMPPMLIESLKRYPHDAVVEALVSENNAFRRYVAVRLGKRKQLTKKCYEEAGALLFKKVARGLEKVLLLDIRQFEHEGLDLLTGIFLSGWRFDLYRTELKPEEHSAIEKIVVLCTDPKSLEARFNRIMAIVAGVNYAREMTSEPPNVSFPMAYAERLRELTSLGVEVEIFDEKALADLGLTALLAVGQGSGHETCMAVLKWNGLKEQSQPIAVVGKGVCFDSGGICLKPTAHQLEMKWDKAGAGVVAGLIKTLALSKAPVHVIGVVGLVENMPDGKALRTSDVIRTLSGQTIEVVNTDAEGRLVLADCLWYVQAKYKPKALIDLGTLTPETFATLGSVYAGLYSNDKDLVSDLEKAGERSGDLVWELPMGEYYAKQLESPIADIRNLGVEGWGENGAAAEFLKRFIITDSWAHLDIAGVSWTKEELPLFAKGVTGFGVRLLEEWIHARI